MRRYLNLVFGIVAVIFATETYAVSQLYDKDKAALNGTLYGACIANNKKSEAASNTKPGFVDAHCKCFASAVATKLSLNKQFVDAYNNKDSDAFGKMINQVAPSINSECFDKTLKQYNGTALSSPELSKISDRVGLDGAEKESYIKSFVYSCSNDPSASKHSKQKVESYCTCVAETTAARISNRDVAQFGMGKNSKRADEALSVADSKCASNIK